MKGIGIRQARVLKMFSHDWQNFKMARTEDGLWPEMRGLLKRDLIEIRPHQLDWPQNTVMKPSRDLFQGRLKVEV